MKLIIGGAYQGKLAYAKEKYEIQDGWIDGNDCEFQELETCRGIFQFHELIKRIQTYDGDQLPEWMCGLQKNHALELEQESEQFVKELLQRNPNIIIVTNELGCGVVPMDRKDRVWRETTGRVCTCLAAKAEEVIRVMCGIGTKLK